MSSSKWKKDNTNYGIKVSSATVAKLQKGTKAGNIAAANKPGASAELREAVRRFYGKGAIKATPGKIPSVRQTGPAGEGPKTPKIQRGNPKPTQAEMDAAKKRKAKVQASAISSSRGNPKPTQLEMAAAKKRAAARQAAADAKKYAPLKTSGGNPKPTQREMDLAKKRSNKKQSATLKESRSNPKPSQAQLNSAARAKALKAAQARKKATATGANTPKNKISGSRYQRSY